MKHLVTAVILVVALAGFASAQVPSPVPGLPFSIYASGAISVPASPSGFKDTYKTGFHGSLGVGMSISPAIQLVGKIETHQFKVDFDNIPTLSAIAGIDGGKNQIYMFGVDARFSMGLPAAPMKPFFIGGLGLANVKQTDYTSTNPLSTSTLNAFKPAGETKVYFNIGAGVDLKSSPAFGLFAQIRYVNIATSGGSSGFIPVSLGLRFF